MKKSAILVSIALAAAACGLLSSLVRAQSAMIGYAPRELVKRPIGMLEGVGVFHDPATTQSREAQAFYDQGMALVMSYEWIDAARSFHQALRLDPKLALAWLGLSDAYYGLQDADAARDAHAKAAELAPSVSERERRRIEIRARQLDFMSQPQNGAKYAAWRKSVEDAITADPGDAVLWLLRGMLEEGTPFGHGQGGGPTSIALYEAVLTRSPDNLAAHHYLAHTYENLGRMQDALAHVEIYARLAPAIPHAHHMVGHILRRMGRPEDAIQQFLEADRLEDARVARDKIAPGLDWHYAHNLSLLGLTYEYTGQRALAETNLKKAFPMPAYVDLAEFNRKEWPEFLLAQGRLPEALAAARDIATNSKWTMGRAAGHTLTGRVLLAMGQTDQAQAELDAAEQVLRAMNNPAPFIPYVEGLRGEIDLSKGNTEQAMTVFKTIEPSMRAISGPDAWTETLFWLEHIFKAARKAGNWDLAEFTAQQMLEHDPHYGGTQLALALVAEHRGDAAAAQRGFAAAAQAWSHADADFPPLAELRQKTGSRH
ncbi:MAG TPA: tetratricopeptide repeat protein [Candidatus Acidoferrum sp.]|nr:tetratricopeptide repeat protein [Candidatus Acidoferrum sp.]